MRYVSSLTCATLMAALASSTPAAAQTGANRAAPQAKRNEPGDTLPGNKDEQLPNTMDTIAEQVETPYRPKPGSHLVKFNLEDADLAELVNHISGLTGRRFIYGAKVRQIKVTVVSPTPVTLDEAYEAFLSILDANGMTVIPHGRFLKIVDSAGIASKDTPIYSRGAPVPSTDRMITRLYRLKHASASEVSKLLAKYKSKDGDVSFHEEGQLLILTDTGTQIRRMIRLIEEVDLGGVTTKMWIVPVHYGDSEEFAKQFTDIYELGKKGTGASMGLEKVVAEPTTNSLVVVGTEESYLRLLELLKRVDIAPAAEGKIHVLPLQNADSDELAKTLNQMLGGTASRGGKGKASDPVADMFEGEIRVTSDKPTNSLIVASSARDFAQLRLVIEKLDKKRRQVFLEAVIMDASVDRSTSLNMAYHGGIEDVVGENTALLGGVNPLNSLNPSDPSLLQALALHLRGPEMDVNLGPLGTSVPAFGVLLNALAQSGDSNVLSTPHIIALDNTEAEINIGENVPLQTNLAGGFSGLPTGGGQNPAAASALAFSGFSLNAQRTDVGTKIRITPHINDENQVRLEIEEEISETGAPVGALGAIPITKRTAKTTVVVDDQQTVVIGGLMRDTKEKGAEKVPVLGDLPILGFLFRNSSERMRKTNLLLILTPHVVRDQGDLRAIFKRKMQERQEFLDRYFVFNAEWEPPRDYSRTNGLVEDIRQAYFKLEDQERLERESRPAEHKFHQASPPLDLSTDVRGVGDSAGGGGKPKAKPKAAPKPRRKGRSQNGLDGPLKLNRIARSMNGVPPVAANPVAADAVEEQREYAE